MDGALVTQELPVPETEAHAPLASSQPLNSAGINMQNQHTMAPTQVDTATIQQMLQSLPTKANILALKEDFTSTLRSELAYLTQKVEDMATKVNTLDSVTQDQSQCLAELERSHVQMATRISSMQLRMEDQKDRHCRNNLRIRCIPEDAPTSDLRSVVQAILNTILERPLTEPIELDRVHHVFLQRGADASSCRDMLCRVYFYTPKENILCKAWQSQGVEYEGTTEMTMIKGLHTQVLNIVYCSL